MPDALIYVRVSHLNRSVSVRDQEKECRAVCERNDWPVREVFKDDGISASRHGSGERLAWIALKDSLQPGDILVVWEASRAHRDLAEYVNLRQLCVDKSVKFSYAGKLLDLSKGDDRFSSGIDALVAERESDLIRERVLRGKRSAAESGKPSGRPPWGYRQKVDGDTPIPCTWELDPVEAPRVRESAERFLRGESISSLVRWLSDMDGWTPANHRSLQRALLNPALAGLKVHLGEIKGEGKWPPILTQERHYEIVNRVADMKRAYGHAGWQGPEPKHLLTGIAKCGVCAAPVVRKVYKDTRQGSYACPSGHAFINAERLDREVEDEVLEIVSKIDPSKYRSEDPGVQKAIDDISAIERELDEWIDKAGRREVSAEAFSKIERNLRNQITTLRPKTIAKGRALNLNYDQIQKRWMNGTVRQKRDVIRAFVAVTVTPAESDYPEKCERCGGDEKVFARGYCRNCYLYAWRGKIPMPPKRRKSAGFVIDPI